MRNYLSIVVLTRNRLRLLSRCLSSIERAINCYGSKCEVVVVVNGKDHATTEYLKGAQFVNAVVLKKPVNRGKARNIAVSHTCGDILYFLDDDILLDSKALITLNKLFNENPTVSIVGGPNIEYDENDSFQHSISLLLSSPFCVGPFYSRYSCFAEDFYAGERSLMLCNLAIRKSVFLKYKFRHDLVSGEENVLVRNALKAEAHALHSSRLAVRHWRGADNRECISKFFSYGRGRGDDIVLHRRWCSIVMLIVIIVVLFLYWDLFVILYVSYACFLIVFNTLYLKKQKFRFNVSNSVYIAFLTPILQSAYFLGVILQIFRHYFVLLKRKDCCESGKLLE